MLILKYCHFHFPFCLSIHTWQHWSRREKRKRERKHFKKEEWKKNVGNKDLFSTGRSIKYAEWFWPFFIIQKRKKFSFYFLENYFLFKCFFSFIISLHSSSPLTDLLTLLLTHFSFSFFEGFIIILN